MKKFLAMAVVALVGLMATACSTDDAVSDAENYATVSFTVAAPEMATRTLGNGMTARNLSWGVYDADGNYLPKLSSENAEPVVFPAGSLSTTVEIDLVNGKSYHIIFWAEADGSPYKVDFETKQMTYDYNEQKPLLANQEKYDAFFASLPIVQVNGPRREPVELKRPFAQLNIATADTKKAADGGLVVDKTQVEVTTCNTLNLYSGEASGTQKHCFALAELIDSSIKVGSKEYDLLSMNYLLVNGEKELVAVEFSVAQGDSYVREYEYQSVPLRRNYKTNIIGNLLTSTLDFDITINPIFAEEEYVVRASVEEVLTLGGKFSMTADEVVEVGNAPIVVPEDGLIELNGNTLTFESETEDAVAYVVEDGVTVTFADEAVTRAGGRGRVHSNSKIGSARRGGKIVVEGGHYFTTGSTLFEADGGELHINGGVFEVLNDVVGALYALFNNSGSIFVSGGEFWGFNPGNARGKDYSFVNYLVDGLTSYIVDKNEDGVAKYGVGKVKTLENVRGQANVYQGAFAQWAAPTFVEANDLYYIIKCGDKVYGEDKSIAMNYYVFKENTFTESQTIVLDVEAYYKNTNVKVAEGRSSEFEIYTMCNFEEPIIEVNQVGDLYEVKVSNLVNTNYAYAGGTLKLVKDGEVVHTLVNNINDGFLRAWAGYKRWALNAQDNRVDWTWDDEAQEVRTHYLKGGDYTIEWEIDYVVNKNGCWAVNDGGVYVPQEDKEGATHVYFSGGLDDVLGGVVGKPQRITKSGTVEVKDIEQIAVKVNNIVANPALYQGLGIYWDAVKEAESYKVYVDKEEMATVTEPTVWLKNLTEKSSFNLFEIEVYDEYGDMIGMGSLEQPTQIFSLTDRPEPNVTFENGKLNVSGYKGGTRTDNIHEKGVLLGAHVFFFKDGASNPTYTAEATYLDMYPGANLELSIEEGRIKSTLAAALTKWHWNGASEAVATAPEMEPGTYKVRYEADYYPIINGEIDQTRGDRVKFPNANSVLQTLITRSGTEEFEVVVEEKFTEMTLNITTPQQYQALSVDWDAVDGAMSYKVYVDDELKTEVTESSALIEGLADKRFYNNIKVEAYGANGKLVGEGVSTANSEVFTMSNWEEPQFNFNKQDDGTYQVVVSNLVNLNYAYAGGATIELVKDGQVVYSLQNNTVDGTLVAWARYKRWAFNAQDNRKDWKWTVNGVEESKEVNKHAIEPGTYTIRWQWDYVLNKNGKWATGANDSAVVSDKKAALMVYFSGDHSDVLWTTYGSVPYRMQKSGVTTATIQ